MVDAELGRDLMSFGLFRCWCSATPRNCRRSRAAVSSRSSEPDAMLTEVHRQAQDDPIVRMSMDIREGRELEIGRHGEERSGLAQRTRSGRV